MGNLGARQGEQRRSCPGWSPVSPPPYGGGRRTPVGVHLSTINYPRRSRQLGLSQPLLLDRVTRRLGACGSHQSPVVDGEEAPGRVHTLRDYHNVPARAPAYPRGGWPVFCCRANSYPSVAVAVAKAPTPLPPVGRRSPARIARICAQEWNRGGSQPAAPAEVGRTARNSLKRLVPQAGLEPARPCGQQILSPGNEA